MSDITERLDKLKAELSKEDFLEGKGLSNEVNIRIFPYDIKDEMAVCDFTKRLINDHTLPCNIMNIDLYDVLLSICKEKGILDQIPKLEKSKGKEFIYTQLTKLADNDAYVSKIRYSPHYLGDVVFITGVGKVYPFVRVHSILEAMQPYFNDVPIVVMYPGTFDGRSLKLFGMLPANSYYRAFKTI